MSEIHKCGEAGCNEDGIACYLPFDNQNPDPYLPFEYLCAEHMVKHGYCLGCGWLSAGMDGFDVLHPGLCDNCKDDGDWDDERIDEDTFDDIAYWHGEG
jgi:hypothetical protein